MLFTRPARISVRPLAPVSRINEKHFLVGMHPSALCPPAGENERVHFPVLVHANLQIAV